jgi:hypothetical protein
VTNLKWPYLWLKKKVKKVWEKFSNTCSFTNAAYLTCEVPNFFCFLKTRSFRAHSPLPWHQQSYGAPNYPKFFSLLPLHPS